mgnify:CR=1 FL=1
MGRGHQAYTHKILSGERTASTICASSGGMSGFPKRKESPMTPLTRATAPPPFPQAWGSPQAREILGEDYSVISIIGDGALTGGMAYEH